MTKRKKIIKRVKKLCDVLEIDHVGLIVEGIRKLMDQWNKLYDIPKSIIDCKECPYGHFGECGWARCPTKEEWNTVKHYFQEIYKEKPEIEYLGGPIS